MNVFLENIQTGIQLTDAQMLYYFASYVATLRSCHTPKLSQNAIVLRLRAIRNYWAQHVRSERIFDSPGFAIIRTNPRPPRAQDVSQAQKDRAVNAATDEMMSRIEQTCCPNDRKLSLDFTTQTGHDNLVRWMIGTAAWLLSVSLIRTSNINSKKTVPTATKWADRTRLPSDSDALHQQRIDDYILGHSMQQRNVFMGNHSDLEGDFPTAEIWIHRTRATPRAVPRYVKFRDPTDKTHQSGHQSQEFHIDAESCQEHYTLARMMSTVARNTSWADGQSLFFSCPSRPTKQNRPRRGTQIRNIRSKDISDLAKEVASAEGLDGTWGGTTFKRKGMNDLLIRDGLTIEQARLESRHKTSTAYARYTLPMIGPAGQVVSGPRITAGPSRTTRAPAAVSNQLVRLNNAGTSASRNRLDAELISTKHLTVSEANGYRSTSNSDHPCQPKTSQPFRNDAVSDYIWDTSGNSDTNDANFDTVQHRSILKPFNKSRDTIVFRCPDDDTHWVAIPPEIPFPEIVADTLDNEWSKGRYASDYCNPGYEPHVDQEAWNPPSIAVIEALDESYSRQSLREHGSPDKADDIIWSDPHFNEKISTARNLEPIALKRFHGRQQTLTTLSHQYDRHSWVYPTGKHHVDDEFGRFMNEATSQLNSMHAWNREPCDDHIDDRNDDSLVVSLHSQFKPFDKASQHSNSAYDSRQSSCLNFDHDSCHSSYQHIDFDSRHSSYQHGEISPYQHQHQQYNLACSPSECESVSSQLGSDIDSCDSDDKHN